MENILTLNQSIFGTKTKERRISRRALKASVQELYVPQESEEITYDEGYDIDGGWILKAISSASLAVSLGCFVAIYGSDHGWWKLSKAAKLACRWISVGASIVSQVTSLTGAAQIDAIKGAVKFLVKYSVCTVLRANAILSLISEYSNQSMSLLDIFS